MPVTASQFTSGSFTCFFGEDDGHGDATPGQRAGTPAGTYTQANAALALFQSYNTLLSTPDSLEDLAVNAQPSLGAFVRVFSNGITATFNSTDFVSSIQEVVSPTGTDTRGRYPYQGTKYLDTRSVDFATDFGLSISFSPAARGFAHFGSDIGEFTTTPGTGDLVWRVTFDDASWEDIVFPNLVTSGGSGIASGSMLFCGAVVNDTRLITNIKYFNNSDGAQSDVWAFDYFYSLANSEAPPPVATCDGDVQNIIFSIRDQIPDPPTTPTDPNTDGRAFTYASINRWIDDAGRILCGQARVIVDWHALQSTAGMDTYELPTQILDVMECFYDLEELGVSPERNDQFKNKVRAPSYSFAHHASHAIPRLHVWPMPDRSGAVTTLNGAITSSSSSLTLTSSSAFLQYGFLKIDSEIIMYRTITGNVVTTLLRGQSLTLPASHSNGATVTELNLTMKVHRMPMPCNCGTRLEIPSEFWPLVELYVLSKVREAEQDHETAGAMRREFDKYVQEIASRNRRSFPRQGTQVGTTYGGQLWGGRVIVP